MYVFVGRFTPTDAGPEDEGVGEWFAFAFNSEQEAREWVDADGIWYPDGQILEVTPPPDNSG